MSDLSRMYQGWLLDCVMIRGWSTLKCARMINANPKEVRRDFERALATVKKDPAILKRPRLPEGD